MEFGELERQLKKGGLDPVYLVLGPEPFLRGEAARLIRERFEEEKGRFDVAELDASEGSARSLFEDLQVPSLFAPRRLVVVGSAGMLFTESVRMLVDYVRHPARGTVLVLVAETLGKTPRGRKGPKKKKGPAADTASAEDALAGMTIVECAAVSERALPSWCVARARLHGKALDPAAARLLVELAGGSLGRLDGQIQALAAYAKDRPRISSEDVSGLVGGDHARNVWELVRAVGDRQAPAALRALDRLLRDGEITGTGIVILLAREARRLARMRAMLDRRTPLPEIARRMRLQEWLANRLAQSARQLSAEELQGRMEMLLEAELACKTGAARERWVLERTVLKLCGSGAAASRTG